MTTTTSEIDTKSENVVSINTTADGPIPDNIAVFQAMPDYVNSETVDTMKTEIHMVLESDAFTTATINTVVITSVDDTVPLQVCTMLDNVAVSTVTLPTVGKLIDTQQTDLTTVVAKSENVLSINTTAGEPIYDNTATFQAMPDSINADTVDTMSLKTENHVALESDAVTTVTINTVIVPSVDDTVPLQVCTMLDTVAVSTVTLPTVENSIDTQQTDGTTVVATPATPGKQIVELNYTHYYMVCTCALTINIFHFFYILINCNQKRDGKRPFSRV